MSSSTIQRSQSPKTLQHHQLSASTEYSALPPHPLQNIYSHYSMFITFQHTRLPSHLHSPPIPSWLLPSGGNCPFAKYLKTRSLKTDEARWNFFLLPAFMGPSHHFSKEESQKFRRNQAVSTASTSRVPSKNANRSPRVSGRNIPQQSISALPQHPAAIQATAIVIFPKTSPQNQPPKPKSHCPAATAWHNATNRNWLCRHS